MQQSVVLLIFVLLQLSLYISAQEQHKCSKHEVPDPCVNPCQPTCAEPNPPVCNFLVCNKGCVCKPGLLRDTNTNQCVPPHLCPKGSPVKPGYGTVRRCKGTNQVFSTCASPCPETCQTPCKEPVFCPAVCGEGCVCIRGFVYDEVRQKCIPRSRCPKCS